MTTPSKYTPIWEQLKLSGKCSITAPPPLHKRIIKAVIKRKDVDIAFKFLLAEKGKRAYLNHRQVGSIIHFSLKYTIGVEDL